MIISDRMAYHALHEDLGQTHKGMQLRLFLSVLDGMGELPAIPVNDSKFMKRLESFMEGREWIQGRRLLQHWI